MYQFAWKKIIVQQESSLQGRKCAARNFIKNWRKKIRNFEFWNLPFLALSVKFISETIRDNFWNLVTMKIIMYCSYKTCNYLFSSFEIIYIYFKITASIFSLNGHLPLEFMQWLINETRKHKMSSYILYKCTCMITL